jgi:tetratricopeptide (TPR) repeat protein
MMAHRSFSDENIATAPVAPEVGDKDGVIVLAAARFHTDDRRLIGAGGETRLEPRVAQLLVLLAGRRGEVVKREELQRAIWPDVIVGDDSLNRLVAALRRALRAISPGDANRIETISKAGYRLAVEADAPYVVPGVPQQTFVRRHALASLGAAAAAAVAGGVWWLRSGETTNPHVERLLEQARVAQGMGLPEADETGTGLLNEAIALEPDNATAWGMLALANYRSIENGTANESEGTASLELAARRALAIDPEESNARGALAILPPIYGDWLAAERRYDAVLKADPDNLPVTVERGLLLMSVGRCREALASAEHALRLSPFAPALHYHHIFRLSAAGRPFEADRAAERAAQLWPRHPGILYARFLVFAWSHREAAALRMLDSPEAPLPPPLARSWRPVLESRVNKDDRLRREAADALIAQATAHTAAAVNSILGLALLDELDAAFEVARGYLLRRGSMIGSLRTPDALPVAEQRWRKTMMLFTPATTAMRADPRFAGLTENMGLAEYWRRSGKKPDFMLL